MAPARAGHKKLGSHASAESRMTRPGAFRKVIDHNEAYSFALRTAVLEYLTQPRAKRLQHVPGTTKPAEQRSSASIADLTRDFSLMRDSKSTRFPREFMTLLDKRMTGVLIGTEPRQEYKDPVVKRTFAVFLNEFKKPEFRKSMERDRRVEDLLLIFFSHATKELSRGKPPDDDSWKLMVDRHVALFVRLISATLKENDWIRDRPELATRLQTLETKLLAHDNDLSATAPGGVGGTSVEVEVPRSFEVKDMPAAQEVAKIFNKTFGEVQQDIIANRSVWTEKAALQDLKMYQTNLSLNTKRTLTSNDFDLDEGYETWKKAETHDLSQMLVALLQANPDLARTGGSGNLALLQHTASNTNGNTEDIGYADISRKMDNDNGTALYGFDQPVDMSALSLSGEELKDAHIDTAPYTFIPSDARAMYRYILNIALTHDLHDPELQPSEATADTQAMKLLSKPASELLTQIGLRWRLPQFTRMVLFLDVIKEKYLQQEVSVEVIDAAFVYIKEPPAEGKKGSVNNYVQASLFDRSKWTIADFALNQTILSQLHDALLRELFELFQRCYEKNPPSIGPVMYVLENHIYDDPLFNKTEDDLDAYSEQLREALRERAAETYQELLSKNVPKAVEEWEFYHVIQLGKAVVGLCNRIQKRYRKNPNVMGVSPLEILIAEILPNYAEDARGMVSRIMDMSHQNGQELPIQDGFDLYRELVEIRRVHSDALPDVPFGFQIEDLLSDFVWRWLESTEQNMNGWVTEAVKQDQFVVRCQPGNIPTDEERHSESVLDIFRSFHQSFESIADLNWDEDFQYAKFMTALSRTLGRGISEYCELLETRFAKEMDRLTPEQEAAARQSRQEKWVQMAREFYQRQDKIEPFQFLPESLVKLNDVEYATLEWDKMEKEINVDACAEVINSQTTAAERKQQRKIEKYVFTIKIIEAEDLKACDVNGLSDPYVVLGDEYQKRLAKTRIIYSNLNPRWDETVDISTDGSINIIATIWDWDALGDHDCVGRTSLKLDPSHFRDYLPREYWLDLDTQGRLLLRVSMEGERDDIQFYFGKAFRTLKRTERDMTRKITDKLSAYINHCLSSRALRALINKGGVNIGNVSVSVSTIQSLWQRGRVPTTPVATGPTQAEILSALKPLFTYFDDNFAIMKETLTDSAMITVMTRLWKEVLSTIESLLVPPLSDKPSSQRQVSQAELDIVYKWLQMLFDFFNAVDEDTGIPQGVPTDILKSPKYQDLISLNFFYFQSTDDLIRESERLATDAVRRRQELARKDNRSSAPATLGAPAGAGGAHTFGGGAGLMGLPSTRRSKSIMLSRNLGTMKKAKEAKRREAQAEPSDDLILRILRCRPEAEKYLKDRSRQRERLAATAAAEMIVRQSMLQNRLSGIGPPPSGVGVGTIARR